MTYAANWQSDDASLPVDRGAAPEVKMARHHRGLGSLDLVACSKR
jgi:hypothetical protein